jgi:multidrug efflux pump
MALVVSVGFVVDDAIVMIENTFRNLKGPPRCALPSKAHQIGFTVITIVFRSWRRSSAPLHGRYRWPFLPRILGHARVCNRHIDGGVADRHADDLRTLYKEIPSRNRTRLDRAVEGVLGRLVSFYAVTLSLALRHRVVMLAIMAATVVITVDLYYKIPKAQLPQAKPGLQLDPRLARRFIQDHGRA